MEKRACCRNQREIPFVCRHFTTQNVDDIFSGSSLNFCENGMYMESRTYLKEKETLLVRVNTGAAKPFETGETAGFRTVSIAEVRWSRTLEDASGSLRYGYGMRYVG
jgi:hypothetical protein